MDEWILIRLDRALPGGFERHREGNHAKFNLETGRRLLLEKGEGWRLVHYKTMVEPLDHSAWLVKHGAAAAGLLERTPER
jgi:hypothetical protein